MQKELSLEYNELSTPFEWSYSPITQMWYEDTEDIKPEFPIDTTWEADNVYVRLNDDCDEKSEEEFEQYINYLFGNISNGCDCFSLIWIFKAKNIVTSDIKYLEVYKFVNISLSHVSNGNKSWYEKKLKKDDLELYFDVDKLKEKLELIEDSSLSEKEKEIKKRAMKEVNTGNYLH